MREELEKLVELKRLAHWKGAASQPPAAVSLGPALVDFYKKNVEKRSGKMGQIAEAWQQLVPELLSAHCALEGFLRGTLTVAVDSSSHLYELRQLLQAGLEKQIMLAAHKHGLRKITLKSGRWYDGEGATAKVRF